MLLNLFVVYLGRRRLLQIAIRGSTAMTGSDWVEYYHSLELREGGEMKWNEVGKGE